MQNNRSASTLARQYIGGTSAQAAVDVASILFEKGIRSSLFYLGEYVDSDRKVAENLAAKLSVIKPLAEQSLDLHISVDPTQLGGSFSWKQAEKNIKKVAQAIAASDQTPNGVHCVMLDMEDYSVNKKTIELHDHMHAQGLPVGVTLQAYLRKTADDMTAKIRQGAKVRLVKGAFAAGPALALKTQREIKDNYRRLIDLMLSKDARTTGFYPIFATHDHQLMEYAISQARIHGWEPGSYEFEMLYGARNDLAEELANRGERIRLYLPFGMDWWPYAVRRIGENPRSLMLLLRSLGPM